MAQDIVKSNGWIYADFDTRREMREWLAENGYTWNKTGAVFYDAGKHVGLYGHNPNMPWIVRVEA
jgi:hypothetical protein